MQVQNQTLAAVAAYGAIPMVDWNCGDSDANVIAGVDDTMITGVALRLASYARPVFLRWYWEPNFPNSAKYRSCIGQGGTDGYVAAWQHIWRIFQAAGATNVAFVWNPGAAGDQTDLLSYYPGNQYVDWIGIDGYDRKGTGAPTFGTVFRSIYTALAPFGKPMMVAETGATTDQPAYLNGIAQVLPSQFPLFKALIYFDSFSNSNWTFTAGGLNQFSALARQSYFSQMP
jgi:beta-mannanase